METPYHECSKVFELDGNEKSGIWTQVFTLFVTKNYIPLSEFTAEKEPKVVVDNQTFKFWVKGDHVHMCTNKK
jgi:hypothetical protein